MDISRTDFHQALERVVQLALNRNDTLSDLPVVKVNHDFVQAESQLLNTPLPEKGQALNDIFSSVYDTVLKDAPNANGPRYFGLITGGTTPASIVGDFLATLYDLNVSLHLPKETIATAVEQLALDMVLDLCYIPREAYPGKILTTGATASNAVGLMVGRQWVAQKKWNIDIAEDGFCGKTIKLIGGSVHSSVIKAAAMVGIGRRNCIDVSLDDEGHQWDLEQLEKILSEQQLKDNEASIVVVGYGEINTGCFAADVLKIRELCTKYDAWLHIDAAFGMYARAIPSHAHMARHIEVADSMTSDGHKWLNVPYDCGLFYTKHVDVCEQVFGAKSAYLATADAGGADIRQPLNMSIENSRRFRALPLYMSLLTYGAEGYRDMFASNCRFTELLGDWINEHAGLELLKPVQLHNVLFRATADKWNTAGGNDAFIDAIKETGLLYVSKTVWKGKPAIRAAVSNWRTSIDTDLPITTKAIEIALQS
ncbi:hypothetical protein VKS41_002510 [Umbelopsis sp. WA50703]